jgi:MYXO-CTERM domain-containing protein
MGLQPRFRLGVVTMLIASSFACGGQSCSCLAPIPGGFPTADRRPRAIQVRATESLFSYLEAQAPTLLPALLPTGSVFNVPSSCGGSNPVCCGAPMCRIQFGFQTLQLTPTAPNVVHFVVTMTLKTLDDLPVGTFLGTCNVSLDSTLSGVPTVEIDGDLSFPINSTTDATELALNNVNINNLESGDFNFDDTGSDAGCIAISLLSPIVVPIFGNTIKSQLQSTVAQQACMKCMTKNDCNSFASDCTGGVCVFSDGKTCVQELGVSGRMDVGAALSSISPGLSAKMDLLAVLGDYAQADTGLSLGMLGGSNSPTHNACVPVVAAPADEDVAQSPVFTTDVAPDGQPYHLGIGVHRSFLDRAGWSAFDAGALCIKAGTPSVPLLSTATLGAVLPSLADYTHNADVPVYVVARPEKPPTFTLGKGTFTVDKTGNRVIDDPLFLVEMPSFHLDFYIFVDEAYVRIMTLNADLRIPVGLDLDNTGKIRPVLGDLKKAFTNLSVTNTDLVSETPADLAATFPTLLGVAAGQLGSTLKPIALPALMGLQVTPSAMTTTGPDANGVNQFLSIYANLSPASMMARRVTDTQAQVASLTLPPTEQFAVNHRGTAEPVAEIDVGGFGPPGLPLEYAWNLDDSGWSPFSETNRLVVRHPLLWLQGRHHLAVQARAVGLPETADPTPADVELLVDTIAPRASLESTDGLIRVVAQDNVSPSTALRYMYAVDGINFSLPTFESSIPVANPNWFRARVIDEAGNVSEVDFHGRSTDPAPASGCGCTVGGVARTSAAGPIALVVIGLLALRRRRAALLALLVVAGAGCSGLGKPDFANPLDEIGRYSDLAFATNNKVFHLSAYDDTTGDLVYARVTDTTKPLSWQVIDGVDLTAASSDPSDYRHGIADAGPDVGTYTSLAVTRSGDPRIAYHDNTNHAVKYAAGPGHFSVHTIETLDATATGGELGLYTAISLDAMDVPSVAYMVTGLPNGDGSFRSELRLATAHNDSPQASSDWTIAVVDKTAVPCAGLCSTGQVCIQAAMVGGMANGDPAQSKCTAPGTGCATACSATQACIGGQCTTFLATPKPDWPEGIGLFTQALRDPTSKALTLVYHDRTQGDLKLAVAQGNSFSTSFIDGNNPATDVGQFCTARFGDDGTLHVAYVDAQSDQLLYRSVTSGTPSSTQVVDDGTRNDGEHPVGAYASLYAGSGKVDIVYQDEATADLLGVLGPGTWTRNDISTGMPGYGFFPRLASDGTGLWLSQMVYDRNLATPPLGRLQLRALSQ